MGSLLGTLILWSVDILFTLGDFAVKAVGVTAEPEVKVFHISENDKFMILGSDGVWEFISSQVINWAPLVLNSSYCVLT